MARRLFLAGHLRSGLTVTRRPYPVRSAGEGLPGSDSVGSERAGRSTFAVGRRTPERHGVRSVQFPRARSAPLPGPWALTAVVTGDA